MIPILALAFAARAGIALSGDFRLHSDEIMQYLEPAHRLVFGNGAIFWEYHYGARSWLTPGFVAAVLKLLEIVGLDRPFWYVGACQARVLCDFSANTDWHVLFRSGTFWTKIRLPGSRGRSVLVRTRWVRSQADD